MEINNLYNFRNTIRHFLDIDNLILPSDFTSKTVEDTCWTKPFKFRVQKEDNSYRTLKIPNILSFRVAENRLHTYDNFYSLPEMDEHKRLSADLTIGDFSIGEFDRQLEDDFNKLCIYDCLVKLDIHEFYGRLYTHYLDFHENDSDRYITNLNFGATNGLIMGNYLSLYFAEQHLVKISKRISQKLQDAQIRCEFSYFSDDFYFFCNSDDISMIEEIFRLVLDEFDLEANDNKTQIWDYETFNSDNVIARYWKRIVAGCNRNYNDKKNDNKLVFINQLVYRSSLLAELKKKRILITNFFKTKYFRTLELSKFNVKDYDYHQLCFIFRTSPEAMLYSIDRFKDMSGFEMGRLKEFFQLRYAQVLKDQFQDAQLYYFYAISIAEFRDIAQDNEKSVLCSENQVLISLYLENNLFSDTSVETLKGFQSEDKWFQNYHLILNTPDLYQNLEENIEKYLIPEVVKGRSTPCQCARAAFYLEFYKRNLSERKSLVRSVEDIQTTVDKYLEERFKIEERLFEESKKTGIKGL